MTARTQKYHEERLRGIELTRQGFERLEGEFREKRDWAICQAAHAGLTNAFIGDVLGLSRERVRQIVLEES